MPLSGTINTRLQSRKRGGRPTRHKENASEQVLRQFEVGKKEMPQWNNEEDKKIFLQLQKYNLIHLTPEGIIKLTTKGVEALKKDVDNYLYLERYQQRLERESFRRTTEEKLILFVIIPMIFFLTVLYVSFQILRQS